MITLTGVNKYIHENGIHPAIEVVKGKDYFYISGPGVERLETTMIYVCHVNQLMLPQWLEEVKELLANKL